MKYHTNHVIIKIGRISAPGTSSNKDRIPTQRNIKRQAAIPTISRRSPIIGKSKIAATYSLTSSITQIVRKINSFSEKTKYLW